MSLLLKTAHAFFAVRGKLNLNPVEYFLLSVVFIVQEITVEGEKRGQ